MTKYSDAAKRVADKYNMHRLANSDGSAVGRWFAVRLADGTSEDNDTLYDTKRDAVRHQMDEFLCAYIQIKAPSMSYREAETFLGITRKAYDAGFRLADPDRSDGGMDLIPRLTREAQAEQIRALFTGRLPRERF